MSKSGTHKVAVKDLPHDAILVDYKAICRMTSISPSHFFEMRATGRFPIRPIRLGRSVRYDRRSVERWISDGCKPHFLKEAQR